MKTISFDAQNDDKELQRFDSYRIGQNLKKEIASKILLGAVAVLGLQERDNEK